ncbi:MAG: FG-GAP repeat protein [Ignavibacteria bacterium]|nr:FG-GAP repeat protein [Ignavibacteria bacterium]
MKTFISIFTCLLCAAVLFTGFTFETSDSHKLKFTADSPLDLSALIKKSDVKETDNPESSDWYTKALSNIQKAEYNVSFNETLNAYQSPNRANNMRFVYHKNGFTASLRNNKVALYDESDKMIEESDKKYEYLDDWNINFKIKSVSKELNTTTENYFTDFSASEFNTSNNFISIENENLRVEYTNDEKGMRQDFIVKNKPEGNGQLRLNMKAETNLKMLTGGDALIFIDKNGDHKMKYSSLKVWDANGLELRAYFEKNSNTNINSKSYDIVVNDEDAVYPITIDPLSSTPNWTAEINQASAKFGWSVATAGDVNGDGYSEVIVGAPYYDNGQTDEGGVFVYHGSINGLSLTPNWTKESNQASALFGWSVATAGDINGDGYSDVIIGSPTYDSVQTDEGRAYVYYGSASGLQAVHAWKYETNQTGENFGYSVACAGDLNNDGYSDVVIGSPFYDNGQTNEGRAYVFRGSMTGISFILSPWTFESNQADANFGFSVASAGDVNGDGFSDIITGGYRFNSAFSNDGVVYVFHSTGATYPASPTSTRTGTETGEFFGYSVSTAGDVNGDGYSDVIVGAPLYGLTDQGKCYAYLGSSSGIAAIQVWSQVGYGQLGISVSTAGDMNADGYADVILGGNYLDIGQTDEGGAFVYLGYSGGLEGGSSIIYESNQANSQFGFSVATAGDINGDGFSDVIIGAHEYDNGSTGEGAAFVYTGSATGMGITNDSTAEWSSGTSQINAYFGNSVSSAGDVNSDGFSDVIVSAPNYDFGESNEGAAFVYHGSASGLSYSPNWSAEGNQTSAFFGISVSTAGDVNSDGYSDVIIGASLFDNEQTDEGAVFVFHGSASGLSLASIWSAEGNLAGVNFGNSVSSAGDVNGDGYSDVIIGSYRLGNGQAEEGAAFVYHGSGMGLSLASNWSAEGNQFDAGFGISVSSAGDINGDGFSDVIVGALWYDNGQSDEGRVFVYHGSASGLSLTSNWSAEGNQASARFGESVSTAGDVNGDGYTDVIVGAGSFDNGQTNEGRVFIYHGSASGLSLTSNWTAESNQAGAYFGNSVSTAGNVNGDGYSDVIVGANGFFAHGIISGTAFVYKGSTSGLSPTSDWNAVCDNWYASFGISVSSAGDVNGDGYSDVIVGAPYFSSNGNEDEGAAFVYYGGSNGGLTSTVRQFKFGSSDVVTSESNTGTNGSVRLQHFAKSPFGRGQGRIVYETKENGIPFSGSIISNSTSYNSSPPAYTNLGLTGTNISQDMTGFISDKQYKWRARAQYKMTSFPFQKFGPWRYYSNYIPEPSGGFRPRQNAVSLNLTMFIEGFYNNSSNTMISDTLRVLLRNSTTPYAIVDSAKSFLSTTGSAAFNYYNAVNGVQYYLVMHHRNSIETWSKTAQQFTGSSLSYYFSTANTQAYGDNMIEADSSPLRFAIYSGDVNQDGTIDLTDGSEIDNDAFNFNSGYLPTDVNGDEIVDVADAVYADNNSFNFIGKITP